MARLNKKMLRQLIDDRYTSQTEFCNAFGMISLPGLQRWFKTDEIRDVNIDKLAEFFKVETRILNLNSQDIDKDRYLEIISELEKVAERSGATMTVQELSSWAVFIYTNQTSDSAVDTSAFEQAVSMIPAK